MFLNFLKQEPNKGTPNYLRIEVLGQEKDNYIVLHPFIDSFKHTIEPKIQQQEVGLFAVPTYYRNGVAVERYDVTFALPAVDEKMAESNYFKVQLLKDYVRPNIEELTTSAGLLKITMNPLIRFGDPAIGYLTSVDEQIEIDPGFLNGYPKVIRVSLSFAVDKVYEEVFGQSTKGVRRNQVAQANQRAAEAPAGNLAAQAKKLANGLGGTK